jgi:hypothetical protein
MNKPTLDKIIDLLEQAGQHQRAQWIKEIREEQSNQ